MFYGGRNMIYELNDPSKAAPIFADWEDLDTGVRACLDNVMGKIFVTDPNHPKSAMAVIGDFAFFAGEPDLELLRGKPDRWMLVVPQNDTWSSLIEEHFPANKRIRYAIRKETDFDREKLEAMVTPINLTVPSAAIPFFILMRYGTPWVIVDALSNTKLFPFISLKARISYPFSPNVLISCVSFMSKGRQIPSHALAVKILSVNLMS